MEEVAINMKTEIRTGKNGGYTLHNVHHSYNQSNHTPKPNTCTPIHPTPTHLHTYTSNAYMPKLYT